MAFDFCQAEIPGVIVIEPQIHRDSRGFFMEAYKHSQFAAHGITETFVQINHSRSLRGVLRGLHYQRQPMAQGKLARCVAGEIYDDVVDLRRGSPTYGKWLASRLSAERQTTLYIPPGLAHGFCVTGDEADVIYMTTAEYAPADEAGVIWNDPELAIRWPVHAPSLSRRDREWPRLCDVENHFRYVSPAAAEASK